MAFVRPKKHLGQHFLMDHNIAQKIVNSLSDELNYKVLEIGAGTGILSKYLIPKYQSQYYIIEIDNESVEFLRNEFPEMQNSIYAEDFLHFNIQEQFPDGLKIIGNFPYNISSQIVFKILNNRHLVSEMVGMFQKEVAERIASVSGNKTYGILSVLTQAFYKVEYLFSVSEKVFNPPPKVKSAVIKLSRNTEKQIVNEKLFFQVVKTAFGQRRKTLRNSLKQMLLTPDNDNKYLPLRAEQLTVDDFIALTEIINLQREAIS